VTVKLLELVGSAHPTNFQLSFDILATRNGGHQDNAHPTNFLSIINYTYLSGTATGATFAFLLRSCNACS
jgi:hypothetical protein